MDINLAFAIKTDTDFACARLFRNPGGPDPILQSNVIARTHDPGPTERYFCAL